MSQSVNATRRAAARFSRRTVLKDAAAGTAVAVAPAYVPPT